VLFLHLPSTTPALQIYITFKKIRTSQFIDLQLVDFIVRGFFMTLTKACIVENICGDTSLSKKRSAKVFETLLEIMKRTLESREEIVIRRFGKFSVKNNNGRKESHPSTSEEFVLGVSRIVIFRSSSVLIKKINEGT